MIDQYDMAVALVREAGKASPSFVQRRLLIGYAEARALIERMEKAGIVSEPDYTGKREVLG